MSTHPSDLVMWKHAIRADFVLSQQCLNSLSYTRLIQQTVRESWIKDQVICQKKGEYFDLVLLYLVKKISFLGMHIVIQILCGMSWRRDVPGTQ
jgi:hypothetical protein